MEDGLKKDKCVSYYTLKQAHQIFIHFFRKQTFLGKNNKKCVKNSQG